MVKIIPCQESFEIGSSSALEIESKKEIEKLNVSAWQSIEEENRIELNEVEVTENKIERKRAMSAIYGIKATNARTVIQNPKTPKSVFELLSSISGITVMGNLETPTVKILRASNSFGTRSGIARSTLDQGGPLWVIDGYILENSTFFREEWGISRLDIDRIEMIVGADASIYGSRAANGVFLVYTRNGSDYNYINRKEGHLNFQGYSESPPFDNYLTKIRQRPKKYEKGTTTLFWNSKIQTDENGEAIISFSTPIKYNRLELKASTVTTKGEIGSIKVVFEN